MTDRFKNKCFNKDATSYLQQALDWNIFLVQIIFLKKNLRAYFHHNHYSSFVERGLNCYTSAHIFWRPGYKM